MTRRCAFQISRASGAGLIAVAVLGTLCGCQNGNREIQLLDPMPMAEVIARVNANNQQLDLTLRAVGGHARGQITDTDGSRRRFDLDAKLLVRPPRCLRLDLTTLLESQLLFGSNPTKYWVVQPAARAITYGRHDTLVVPDAGDLIIRPDLFVEALGLNPLPTYTLGDTGPMQRITDEHQQLLFLDYDDDGQGFVAKEYWISRTDPPHVTRMIFRDTAGRIALDSQISGYRRVGGSTGPWLPHRVRLTAPATDSWLEFTTWGWKLMPEVGSDHPSFEFPLDRGERFERIVDLDVELDRLHHPFTEEEQLQQLIAPE
jgi:hypothetical protein